MAALSPSAGDNPILQYITTAQDFTNASPYTFSGIDTGAADSNKIVFAYVHINGVSNNITSVVIGGVTAGEPVKTTGLANTKTGIYAAKVPTGTTLSIVVTASGTLSECNISVWKSITPGMVLLDKAVAETNPDTSVVASDVNVKPGGFLIAGGFSNGSTVATMSYNGADSLVVDDNRLTEPVGSGSRLIATSVRTTETVATNDVTITNGSSVGLSVVAASYFVPPASAHTPVLADTFLDGSDSTTYTFTSKSIGTANASRQLLICFAWESATTSKSPNSVTVGGNAATLIATSTGTSGGCSIYRISVASGTTATVVITMSAAVTRMAGGIYDTRFRAYDVPLASVAPITVSATSITSAAIEVRDGGFLVAVGGLSTHDTVTSTYNGSDTLTKDSTIAVETSDVDLFSCLTTETKTTNTAGFSTSGSTVKRYVAASFL